MIRWANYPAIRQGCAGLRSSWRSLCAIPTDQGQDERTNVNGVNHVENAEPEKDSELERLRSEFDKSFFERSVLVKNLPLFALAKHVEDLFAAVGPVLIADVLRRHSGKSLGMAIVEYTTPSHAQSAIKYLAGKKVFNVPIVVEKNTKPLKRDELVGNHIVIHNLPTVTSETDVRQLAAKYGPYKWAKKTLSPGRLAVKSASIYFNRIEDAIRACKGLDERMLNGKILRAFFAPARNSDLADLSYVEVPETPRPPPQNYRAMDLE